ncbi:hypothetical protein ACFWAT_08760 [Streptomyces syringium]|uniref:hypothetical protein n=1 Tax=Streptomyces syringium TaxID=76729 RepID=UPI00365A5EF9
MTVCVPQSAPPNTPSGPPKDRGRTSFTVTADGSYAAWLALGRGTGGWFPERWTLGGPEPYAVPLPGSQPEEPDSEVLPLADGRVLIRRRVAERYALSLLYPTGPGTGELPLGAIECPRLSLLPPAPDGSSAFALVHGERSTTLWRVHGGAFGPERVTELPGRCGGGAWLDRTGRMLALDRELDGRTKAVVVDLGRGGETSPLLQITEESNDRLLLADPDSGLLLVRSDAPGQDRLGWGVLGSARPVRFPECLRMADAAVTPFAAQPGQVLMPEGCAVALRIDGAAGSWVGVWRPSGRRVQQFPAPVGWLAGAGLWTADGELRLPYVTPYVPCGLARLRLPGADGKRGPREEDAEQEPGGPPQGPVCVPPEAAAPDGPDGPVAHDEPDGREEAAPPTAWAAGVGATPRPASHAAPSTQLWQAVQPTLTEGCAGYPEPDPGAAPRPVPLQQAPLGRTP